MDRKGLNILNHGDHGDHGETHTKRLCFVPTDPLARTTRIGSWFSVVFVVSVVQGLVFAQPLPYEAKGQHLGVVNCASSLCHGSVSPWKDANILQSEYVTWSRVDKHHTRAYQVLSNERSRRIAKNLGLKQPAHEAKICLDCHAHNPPPAQRGERFKVADGVGCEGCHGPAEGWIEAHTAPGASHADNVKRGLYPTSDPVALARLCLACHLGNKDKFVTHRMMGAGHPRMSFELDTFAQTQPPHFVADADWERRKGAFDSVRLWAVGQALAATETLDILLDPKRARDGLFPELAIFDCHACHHAMSELRWTPRVHASPGRIRLNDSAFLMLRQIARRTLPAEAANEFAQRVGELHRAVAGDGGETVEAARALRATVEAMTAQIARRRFSGEDLRAIAMGLVDDGAAGQYHDYAGAEQATMAIGSVLAFMGRRGELADVAGANAALGRMHAAVREDEKYRPERFREELAALGRTLGR
jgi:hypothetical protein